MVVTKGNASVKISLKNLMCRLQEKDNLVFERDSARRGFASKMEEALFKLQTCSENPLGRSFLC